MSYRNDKRIYVEGTLTKLSKSVKLQCLCGFFCPFAVESFKTFLGTVGLPSYTTS